MPTPKNTEEERLARIRSKAVELYTTLQLAWKFVVEHSSGNSYSTDPAEVLRSRLRMLAILIFRTSLKHRIALAEGMRIGARKPHAEGCRPRCRDPG
jgi:hypothetical protein